MRVALKKARHRVDAVAPRRLAQVPPRKVPRGSFTYLLWEPNLSRPVYELKIWDPYSSSQAPLWCSGHLTHGVWERFGNNSLTSLIRKGARFEPAGSLLFFVFPTLFAFSFWRGVRTGDRPLLGPLRSAPCFCRGKNRRLGLLSGGYTSTVTSTISGVLGGRQEVDLFLPTQIPSSSRTNSFWS